MVNKQTANEKALTAGEKSLKASTDQTRYDPLEASHAFCEDYEKEFMECVRRHDKIFNEDEYCVVVVLVKDALLKNVLRNKFYGWLFLPKPRVNQTVYLYNKVKQKAKMLWCLPNAYTMAHLGTLVNVNKKYKRMQRWCRYFYDTPNFWKEIRKEHNIDLLSEEEFLEAHKTELAQALGNQKAPSEPDAFDFRKILTK